jgi:glycosyltransferase involved in cell wall biosynthesis
VKILIVNTLYPPIQVGGAEKSVSLLAEALTRGGDIVTVVSLHQTRDEADETRNGVRVYRLPLDNLYWPYGRKVKPGILLRLLWHLREMWNWNAAARFGAILDREMPDVVHTNNVACFSVSIWREVRKRNIRLVHTLRDYALVCVHEGMYRNGHSCERQCLDCRLFGVARKAESSKLDAVVSNSNFTLQAHRGNGLFQNVPSHVIYNIADMDEVQDNSRRGARSATLVFGFIGLIEPRKGIEVVLEATTHLVAQDWQLRIAGRGLEDYVAALKTKYTDPRIEWLGFIRAQDFYPAIDVTLVASLWPEPLPRTLIETFAYGRSAICARSGGTPEIAGLGTTVEMYSPEDAKELAEIMDSALMTPTRWREGGFRDADSQRAFLEETVRNMYRSVYEGDPKVTSTEVPSRRS